MQPVFASTRSNQDVALRARHTKHYQILPEEFYGKL